MPTRGMERWLTQRMSWGLGRLARAGGRRLRERRLPDACISSSAARSRRRRGIDRGRRIPGCPSGRSGRCLAIVDECLDEPWLRTLADHLKGPIKHGRRFASLRHLAGLYDRYALHRPEMVRAWAAGEDGGVPDRRRLAGRAVAAAARADRDARARQSGSRPPAPGCAQSRGSSSCPSAFAALQPDAAPGRPPRRAASARRRAGRPPLRPAPLAGAVGPARGRAAGRQAQGRPDRREQRAARLVGARLQGAPAACSSGPSTWTSGTSRRAGTGTLLARIQASVREDRPPTEVPARRQRPGPLVPRPRAPGRGAARHDPASARRRSRRSSRAT